MQPAKLTQEAGHTWWLCPSCGRKLAELIGDRVVIRQGHGEWSMPRRNEPETTCPRCHASSELPEDLVA